MHIINFNVKSSSLVFPIVEVLPGEKGGVCLPPGYMFLELLPAQTIDRSESYHQSQTLLPLSTNNNFYKLRQVPSAPTHCSLFLETPRNSVSMQNIFKGWKWYIKAGCYSIIRKR